ncbi:hypothetical protein EZJ49_08165 [Bdellovibrio bacteriovorus]|uniref:RCC1 domain-containing protein n=1 Tax=Bdellovibrio bacteriovorus TaxID=959 RepID=UPI0021D1F37D|nr:hypothetical protein [Bdellovibrio bacteriovorus]UXR66222.1 hypothetical protein EZJ49_08165 [Bdellovibrio bacteriovorus]
MKNYSVLLLSGLFVGLTGCDRLSLQDSSKVRIQFPSAQSLAAKTETFATTGGTTNDGRPIPTGFTGSAPINCYLVTVTGPEESLRKNTCTRDDNSMTPKKVGPWTGGVPAGGELTMEVPSGESREFSVIGFHAPEGQCKDFKSAGFGDALSRPYMLGGKSGLKLRAGETVVVDVPITYDPEKWFDSCDGPDFPDDHSGPGGSSPTRIASSKDWFPANTYILGACSSVGVYLSDDQNRHGVLPTDTTFSIFLNGVQTNIYQSYEECSQSLGSFSTATIPAGENFKDVVFRVPDVQGSLSLTIADISSSVLLQPQAKTYNIVGLGQKGVELEGASSVLPDLCYPYKITRRSMDAGGNPDNAMSPGTVDFSTGPGLSIYTTAGCSGTPAIKATIPSYSASTAVWIKTSGTAGENTITLSGSGFTTLTQALRRGGGQNIPWGIEVRGHRDGPSRDFCYNSPYQTILVNEQHTAVLAADRVDIELPSPGADYYTDNGCMTTATNSVSIPTGAYSTPFYIKARMPKLLSLQAVATGLQAGSYLINIRGPFSSGTESVAVSQYNGVCAKSPMGTYCWGNPNGGRLGYPVGTQQNIPKYVAPSGVDWSYVKMGYDFSCGLSMAGEVKCWGLNNNGQLGDGTTNLHDLPAPISGADYYSSLSVSAASACAITSSGALKCWGSNSTGVVGDGTTANRSTPVTIDVGASYNQVSVGGTHACGVTNTGTLKCWGINTYGKLGTGDVANYYIPTVIDAGTPYQSVSAGTTHTCAVTTSGQLKCWGGDDFGAIGNGAASGNVLTPSVIDAGTSYTQVAVGEQMSCAVTNMGTVKCWGLNNNGRLGVGTTNPSIEEPTLASLPGPANSVSTGSGTTCAILSNGKLWCWGEGLEGELGIDNPMDSSTPVELNL